MSDTAELLHAGERARQGAGGPTFVCKQPLGPDAARRCRHEQAMPERLAGVDGVIHQDLNPENILLSAEGDRPLLIDDAVRDERFARCCWKTAWRAPRSPRTGSTP